MQAIRIYFHDIRIDLVIKNVSFWEKYKQGVIELTNQESLEKRKTANM